MTNKKGIKPILKWVGGKTQLLEEIKKHIPLHYNKYIEPFIGGGALFFDLYPLNGIIADSNPELINTYIQIAENVEAVIKILSTYNNTEESFYEIRKKKWTELTKVEAAARMIYLNKTCFNGLYRVNKEGHFNVPYGRYKNPQFVDEKRLKEASELLQKTKIICGDYKNVLLEYAEAGDFVFLDPPYFPISEYSDFKRYTKEQFSDKNQEELSELVNHLYKKGCNIILTNSNHQKVFDLYGSFKIEIHQTKRYINKLSNKRKGEDVIVVATQKKFDNQYTNLSIIEQAQKYTTRYMGAKTKLLPVLHEVFSRYNFHSALDLFSGSGVVSYLLKLMSKEVLSNDFMYMNYVCSKAIIENNKTILDNSTLEKIIANANSFDTEKFNNFKDLYFSDNDLLEILKLRESINNIENKNKKRIAIHSLVRACIKKRPRGIFTFVGFKYDDGRRDLKMSITEHFIEAVNQTNQLIIDNGCNNIAMCSDAMLVEKKVDLVYLDPPYFGPNSDNDYVRRYHFVEGLACNRNGLEIQQHTKTKKFKSYKSSFSSKNETYIAFDNIFRKYKDSIIIVSYSSNSLPSLDEMIEMIKKYKNNVEVVSVDYKYSFANAKNHTQNKVQEYLFIGS